MLCWQPFTWSLSGGQSFQKQVKGKFIVGFLHNFQYTQIHMYHDRMHRNKRKIEDKFTTQSDLFIFHNLVRQIKYVGTYIFLILFLFFKILLIVKKLNFCIIFQTFFLSVWILFITIELVFHRFTHNKLPILRSMRHYFFLMESLESNFTFKIMIFLYFKNY